jgi:hypothetical protein
MFDFLSDNPVRHRINVIADDVTTGTVCLQERSPASHERINYNLASEVVAFVEGFSELA